MFMNGNDNEELAVYGSICSAALKYPDVFGMEYQWNAAAKKFYVRTKLYTR